MDGCLSRLIAELDRGMAMKILSVIRAKYRLFFGFCPKCNSDAPEIDNCNVCLGARSYPPSRQRKDELLKRFLMRDEKDWKPIETAPENTLLWLYEPHDEGGFMFSGIKTHDTWRNNLDLLEQSPTHWMPLPQQPA